VAGDDGRGQLGGLGGFGVDLSAVLLRESAKYAILTSSPP